MKPQSILAGLSLALAISPVVANEKGNGGQVIVCYKKANKDGKREINYVELLDFIEARATNKWAMDLGVDNPGVDDTQAMLDLALQRLERIDMPRAQKLRGKLVEMKSELKFLDLEKDKYEINRITDYNTLISHTDKEDCFEKTAAFNRVNPDLNEYRYVFIKQFYDNLVNDTHRAGLILHEAIYNIEAEAKATDSDGSRKIVRLVSSKESESITPKQYYTFITKNSKAPSVTAYNGNFKSVEKWFDDQAVSIGNVAHGVWVDRFYAFFNVSKENKIKIFEMPAYIHSFVQFEWDNVSQQYLAVLPNEISFGIMNISTLDPTFFNREKSIILSERNPYGSFWIKTKRMLRNDVSSTAWNGQFNYTEKKFENLTLKDASNEEKFSILFEQDNKVSLSYACPSGFKADIHAELNDTQTHFKKLTLTPNGSNDCAVKVKDAYGTSKEFVIHWNWHMIGKSLVETLNLEFDEYGKLVESEITTLKKR